MTERSDAATGQGAGARRERGRRDRALQALRFLGVSHRRRRVAPAPGAAPGTLAVSADAEATRIEVRSFGADAYEERTVSADELAAERGRPRRVLWVDVQGLGDRLALERVREAFGIHPLVLADAVHVPQRPKAESYGDHLLVVTQMARLASGGEVESEQVSIVLGRDWVVTFQERPCDVFDPIRARLRSESARVRSMGADYLAYALIDAVIDGYFPVVEALGSVLEDLEEEVVVGPRPTTLTRIHAARRVLLHLHRVQWGQRDAIGSLLRAESTAFSEPVRVYLRDAHDHAFQTVDAIETYRDLAVGLVDVHLSILNNRLNEVMKTLTVMASIFIPLTFLTGIYGMNFERMPELHWRFGYPAALAGMLAVAGGLALWFRRRGWLGSRGE